MRDPDQILVRTLSTYTYILCVKAANLKYARAIQKQKEHRIDHRTKSEVKRDKKNIIYSFTHIHILNEQSERERVRVSGCGATERKKGE